jgi:hypothetical protein
MTAIAPPAGQTLTPAGLETALTSLHPNGAAHLTERIRHWFAGA